MIGRAPEQWGKLMPARVFVISFLTIVVAAIVSAVGHAACKRAPISGESAAYFSAMAKRMAAAHGIGMKKLSQKGNYAGSGFAIVWYRFGTDQENETATGIRVSDGSSPGRVGPLMFLGDNSQASLDRIKTLTVATVSYLARVDEGQITPEIDAMMKKAVALEPTNEDVAQHRWKNSPEPVAEHQWGIIHVGMPTHPQLLNTVQVNIDGICK